MGIASEKLVEGFELPSLSKKVTLDKMKVFSAALGKSIHTDEETAKKSGFPRPLTQGLMYYIYVTEVLVRFFGEDWLRRGKIETAFLKPVFDGDTLSTKVVVNSKHLEGSAERINLDVSCENQRGEIVIAGTATVLVP